ncbi:MAG TPA: Gfo/Idh/MocA family oxidoreductase [Bryobacteraceae bacterium]|jgi:predicted dehydrogenase
MDSERIWRGAIVGCGYFARHHIEAWRRIKGVEILAACDTDKERASAFAPQVYCSPEEMMNRETLDFVDIVTPPATHLELVRLATNRGIPAICQKPMAANEEEAALLVEACRSSGIPVMIHENWRWQPWYRKVKEAIAAGVIGRPITYWMRTVRADGAGSEPYATQPYFRNMPRLLIYETLVHHLDTARFLFGDLASVYALARRRNPVIAGEDQALLALRHTGDVDGCISGHRFLDASPVEPVMGEAVFEGKNGVFTVAPNGDVCLSGELFWKNGVAEGYRGDSVYATQRHFLDCLERGAPFETGVAEYYKSFRAAEAAYESITSGSAIFL